MSILKEIKQAKHKQSKFLTIMLVPYSSKKTRSIKIPHYVFYVFFGAIGISLLAAALIAFLSSSRVNYFKSMADSFNTKLESTREINSQLIEEKKQVESNIEKQKDQYEKQKGTYEEQLKYYEEKANELELKIQELNKAKEEIYDLLTEKTGKKITQNMAFTNVTPKIVNLSFSETASDLNTTYTNLEAQIHNEMAAYENLFVEVKKVTPYLAAIPNIWPVKGMITSGFGFRTNPFTKKGSEMHSGIDIKANVGTSIKATADGKVTFAGYKGSYGYLVIISHGYGYETYYAHNSKILVNVGSSVKRGDVISKAGNSGRSTGPHLHYEVHLNGVLKNPRNYLQ